MKITRKSFLAGLSATAAMGWSRLFAECRPFGAGARVPAGRIRRLLAEALDHDVMPVPTRVEYDPADLGLPEPVRIGKRLKEYLAAQPIRIRPDEELAGWVRFDGSVESDFFQRIGHRAFGAVCGKYYRKPQEALATFDGIRAKEPRLTHAIETSGFASAEDYRTVVSRLDFVYQDVKFPDLDGYRRWAGVDATPIFENIKWLKKSGVPFAARVPCIPGVNDSRETKSAIVQLVDGASNLRGIEFLPYNRLAGAKYAKLGRTYSPGFDESRDPDVSSVLS